MCWNLEVSLGAALYGFAVSYYLYRRGYSERDWWYGAFLASFTSTQLLDAFFWWYKGEQDEIPCTDVNLFFTKFVVSPIIFMQCICLSVFPSDALKFARWPYRIAAGLGCLVPVLFAKCTRVWHTIGLFPAPTLLYWGWEVPLWMMLCGVALWSIGDLMFVRPWWAGTNILLVGGINLILLIVIDGTIRLISKLCFYCLLLSILWLSEPLWAASSRTTQKLPIEEVKTVPEVSEEEAKAPAECPDATLAHYDPYVAVQGQ